MILSVLPFVMWIFFKICAIYWICRIIAGTSGENIATYVVFSFYYWMRTLCPWHAASLACAFNDLITGAIFVVLYLITLGIVILSVPLSSNFAVTFNESTERGSLEIYYSVSKKLKLEYKITHLESSWYFTGIPFVHCMQVVWKRESTD